MIIVRIQEYIEEQKEEGVEEGVEEGTREARMTKQEKVERMQRNLEVNLVKVAEIRQSRNLNMTTR